MSDNLWGTQYYRFAAYFLIKRRPGSVVYGLSRAVYRYGQGTWAQCTAEGRTGAWSLEAGHEKKLTRNIGVEICTLYSTAWTWGVVCLYTHWNWMPGELKVRGIEMRIGVMRGYPAKIGWLGLSVHCRSQSEKAAVNLLLTYLESLNRVIRTYPKWTVTMQYINKYMAVVKKYRKRKTNKKNKGRAKKRQFWIEKQKRI